MLKTPLALIILALAPAVALGCSSNAPAEETADQPSALINDPATLGKLLVWLDPRQGVTVDGAREVTSWADRSGNGVVMARGNPTETSISYDAKSPTWVRFRTPSVDFGDPYLVSSAVVLSPPFTVAMVLRPTGGSLETGSEPMALLGSTAPTISIAERCTWVLFPTCRMAAQSGGNGVPFTWLQGGTSSYSLNTTHFVVAVFNGSSSSLLLDGSNTPIQGNLSAANLNGLVLSAGGRKYVGDMGDVLVYGSALGTQQQRDLRDFLASRYP